MKKSIFLLGVLCLAMVAVAFGMGDYGYYQCYNVNKCIQHGLWDASEQSIRDLCPAGEGVTNVYSSSGGGYSSWYMWQDFTGNGELKYEYDTVEDYLNETYFAPMQREIERNRAESMGVIMAMQKFLGWI